MHRIFFLALALTCSPLVAQSVCIPLPRLLTLSPMGGQIGTTVEVTATGDHLDEPGELIFDHPGIKSTPKRDAAGAIEANKYVLTIDASCTPGIYEARIMSRLGLSSSRVFLLDNLPEVTRTSPNTSLATAMELKLDTICNAVASGKSIDHYRFSATKGQRIVIHCAGRGIDSKLDPVLIVGDAMGRDMVAERRAGLLDFTAPADGTYVLKVHDLTFNGGPAWFYRLSLRQLPIDAPLPQFASTQLVSACSWPPAGLAAQVTASEAEPNNDHRAANKLTLPCDVSGSFYPAADVDVYEFAATKGDVWWVEVASERLGRPTDPAIVVQLASSTDPATATFTDVAEFSDIPSPVKPSSNGYAYDGPPFNAGSTDILGKLEIKQDGIYHLQISDLFGGTRKDPRNVYLLIMRRAQPDFAIVGWGLHMELRNGDRAALSKPLALRAGQTLALEVVTVRRDGFDGPIELHMDNLPLGVTAQGITIPAGKSRGIMLLTASESAQVGLSNVAFTGRATIDNQPVTRAGRIAEIAWPIPDSWGEIPVPRLSNSVPISVSSADPAPLTIRPKDQQVIEVAAGQKAVVPLSFIHRSEFSGSVFQLRTFGDTFERTPQFDVPVTADSAEATLDTGALKTPPGEYTVAFYGGAVAKYKDNPAAAVIAESLKKQADEAVTSSAAEVQTLTTQLASAPAETKASLEQQLAAAKSKHDAAMKTAQQAAEKLKAAQARSAPQDTVDIVVSEPIRIRVK